MCGSSEINCKIYNDMVIETQACVSACTPSEMYSLISQTRNLPPLPLATSELARGC